MDFPPARRGAPLPAKPYSSVDEHHVPVPSRASGDPGVVLHRPQSLIPPSGGTTSIGRAEPPATRAWCFTVRKALFLRPEAPRLSAGSSLRRPGRGASPSAKPYFFVRKHHVYRPGRASGDPDVVLHRPQSLMPSSGSTTSIGRVEPPATRPWCFTIRKDLFLRPETPRHLVRLSLRRLGRGASPSAKPYFFVRKHHVYRPGRASGDPDVVPHPPQSLMPSSGSTTPVGSALRRLSWRRPSRKTLTLRRATPTWPGRASGDPGFPFPIRRECDEHI